MLGTDNVGTYQEMSQKHLRCYPKEFSKRSRAPITDPLDQVELPLGRMDGRRPRYE